MRILFLKNNIRTLHILIGPLFFFFLYRLPTPEGMTPEAHAVLASTFWIAYWWISEAIPIPATSLLPIILFPLTGILDIARTTAAYGHRMVFLYMGGFILALAIEKWDLHRRIALYTIHMIGKNADRIILGFMIATWLLSMWISNTATTLMMLPIALAVAGQLQGGRPLSNGANPVAAGINRQFGLPLMLGIAYSASIGGISTLIGTPTNAMLSAVVKDIYQIDIDFARWISLALPISSVLLVISWLYLVKVLFPVHLDKNDMARGEIERELKALGPLSREERRVGYVFLFTAIAWMIKGFVLARLIPGIDDTVIAIICAIILFIIPSTKKGVALMDWGTAKKLPWGILILFGGGLALAAGFQSSGLAEWMGNELKNLQHIRLLLILLAVAAMVNFLTEVTSNVATASILLPILASVSDILDLHPFVLMIIATLSASCAFMLPVATPPNAVVFSSGYIRIRDMARAGFGLNLISIVVIVIAIWFLLPIIWGIDTDSVIRATQP
jgi:sodium-dependent dicarboxylate transporter 2/3/5